MLPGRYGQEILRQKRAKNTCFRVYLAREGFFFYADRLFCHAE